MQSWFHSDSRCFSSPLSHLHRHGFTVLVLQQVSVKKKKKSAMWRQANLKAIIDHQPPWLVWLQCTRCNWLGTAKRSFNRKYTLSLSISFKKWQHYEKTQLPDATTMYKNWIHRGCHSNADPYNQTKRLLAYEVDKNVQQSLCQFMELPADSCGLLEINIKSNLMYFAAQRVRFRHGNNVIIIFIIWSLWDEKLVWEKQSK